MNGCPDAEIMKVYASWNGASWERNFETIPTGDDRDNMTSHCVALDWADGLEIDLEDYLPELLAPYKDELRYVVNSEDIDGTTIEVEEDEPDDLFPEIYHVEMRQGDTTLDRLWIVVPSPQTRTEFETWVSSNATNAAWLDQLPQPPSKILVNAAGDASLPPAASANWRVADHFSTNDYMHPKAVYELRSTPIQGGHGHQATYDAQGNIITESIKAGTADYVSPSFSFIYGWHPASHRDEDVHPYIRALQLDGNPVHPGNSHGVLTKSVPRNLTRPPLHVGPFTREYLLRRPTTPKEFRTYHESQGLARRNLCHRRIAICRYAANRGVHSAVLLRR